MATLLNVQVMNFEEGVTPTFNSCNTAAGGATGDKFPNNGKVVLYFWNANAAAQIVTIKTPRQLEGLDIEEVTIDLAIGSVTPQYKALNFLPPKIFNQTDGTVEMTYDAGAGAGADLKVAILQASS